MDAGTVESNGFTITSNTETSEAMTAALAPPEPIDAAAAPATAEAEPVAPAAEKPAGKPRSDPRARVEEATSQAAQAKRERDDAIRETAALKARLEALERRPAPPEQPAAKAETPQAEHKRYKAMEGFPKLADFQGEDAFEDWLVAKDLFIADKRFDERGAQARAQAERAHIERSEGERAASFSAKLGATPEERAAFMETVDPRLANATRITALPKGQAPTFGNFLVEQIYRSEAPKELLQHFTAHVEDVQRLAALHPMEVLREIGKLEQRLASPAASVATGTAATPPKSKASPPIQPVKGSSQSASDEPPGDDATDAEHEAYWGKQRKRFRS